MNQQTVSPDEDDMYDRKSFALVRVSVADGAVTISSVYVVCRTRRRRKSAFRYRCYHRAQEGDQETCWPPPIFLGMLAYVQFYSIYV